MLQQTLHNVIGNSLLKNIRNDTRTMPVALENVPVPAPRLLKHSNQDVSIKKYNVKEAICSYFHELQEQETKIVIIDGFQVLYLGKL